MPTVTAVALDRLLEPKTREPTTLNLAASSHVKLERAIPRHPSEKKSIPRPHVSPALYTTPEATPLPDSPSSFPPSPYIINHKRRGPRLLKTFSQSAIGEHQPPPVEEQKSEEVPKDQAEELKNGFHNGEIETSNLGDEPVETEDSARSVVVVNTERDMEFEDFFDPNDSVSVSSNTEVDDSNGPERSWKPATPMGEYYDAVEDISSEGAMQSSFYNIEAELREMRLNLLMEIERRKQAEEVFENLQTQWQRLSQELSLVGLTLPAAPTISEGRDEGSDIDPAEDLHRQVVLARLVAGSIGRGCSRAEVELEMESQIESKNFEIARLWDRLQYYEATNREMSQRNQEAVEMARQHRHWRKRRQKWIWSSIGLAIAIGAATLAWSYLPVSTPSRSHDDSAGSHELD